MPDDCLGSRPIAWVAVIILAGLILSLDLIMPLGVAAGVPYVGLFLIGWWARNIYFPLFIACLSTTLIVLGYLFSNEGSELWMVWTNRSYAVGAIWICAVSQYIAIKNRNTLTAELNSAMDRELELTNSRRSQRFHFETSPLGAVEWNDKFEVLDWNNTAEKIFGFKREEVLGKHITEHILPGLEKSKVTKVWDKLISRPGSARSVNRNITKSGKEILCSWYNTALLDNDGLVIGVSSLVDDITVRVETKQKDQLRTQILSQLSTNVSLDIILDTIVINIEERCPGAKGSILLLDEERTKLHTGAAPNLPDFYVTAIDGVVKGDGVGSCGTAAYKGKRVIVEDIMTHPYWRPEFCGLAAQAGLASCWSEPIVGSKNEVLGTFALYRSEPSCPTQKELTVISEAAELTSLVIEKVAATEQLVTAGMVYNNCSEGIIVVNADNLMSATA